MTNPQPNLLELAKQGNPRAIAVLMNRPLQPRGITADVTSHGGDLLEVTLEAEQTPNQESLAQFVHKGLSNLGIASINRVRLSGKRRGQAAADWVQEFELQALPDFLETPTAVQTPPLPPPPVPTPPIYPDPGVKPSLPVNPAITHLNSSTQLQPESVADIEADIESAESSQAYINQPDIHQPDINHSNVSQPDIRLPDVHASELRQSDIEAAELEAAELETGRHRATQAEAAEEDEADQSGSPLNLSQTILAVAIAVLLGLSAAYIYTKFFSQPQVASSPEGVPIPSESGATSPILPSPDASPSDSPAVAESPGGASPATPATPILASPPESPSPAPTEAAPSPQTTSPEPTPGLAGDPFRDAVNKATEAANLAQTANTPGQWQTIAQLWQEAATLMASVPPQDTSYRIAQDRVPQYLSNRDYAVQRSQTGAL